ncbi:MAG TPA: hypothetical protein ENJ99_04125, partial [Rhizobiales bacterium]|nr:hypothetical protein [Hyphomicrobiales bacterium]
MTSSQHLSKSSLIEKTIALAQQALDQQMLPLGTRFIRQFFANVSNEDLRNQDIENLYGSALAMFAFARKRSAGKAKLRVYTPTPEEHGWKSAHTIVEIVNDDMPFIVDSVASELSRLGPEIYLIIHPVLQVIRDRDGQLIAIEDTASGAADRSNGAM